ncbi:FAD-binding-3 domain-containing protein [Favolaschia claudopus]|uniref:FAD-binding-3 domain-containing protein n=1 Tax=Favolaschia claudopus TaxID=2862362 RepID=A0AAW0BXE0_9AGAR
MSGASRSPTDMPQLVENRQILVVGAGPSGLVVALALRRNGVPVRLIDCEPVSRLGQRGAGIMPRSMELFSQLGVGDEILRRAIPAPPAVMYQMPGGVEITAKFDMWPAAPPDPQRPFPNVVMLGQDHLEQILRTELQRLGCETEWGSTLLSFEQSEDCVRTRISRLHADEETVENATFGFLVGTDGARGMVRKTLGLSFLGETSNAQRLVVGDVMVHGLDPKLWHMWGEFDGAWISLRPTEVPYMWGFLLQGPNIDHAHIVKHPEALASIFVEYTGGRRDLVFGDVVWLSTYRPNIRMVDKFGVGRVFLAGDSAHVHSITGGQGMNVGIQDSMNLAWKLALVQRKLAPESLLHTYTEERAPVVAAMLNQITALLKENWTDKIGAPPPSPGGISAWKHNGGVLQLGVNCRWSSLVVDEQELDDDYLDDFETDEYDEEDENNDAFESFVERPLCAGDRAPDAPGLFVLQRPSSDKTGAASDTPTSLFRTFRASRHTVLIFSESVNRCTALIRLLASLPPDVLQCVVVVRKPAADRCENADWLLEDRAGHAYKAYALRDACDIVIVRPDGLIGAIVRSRNGLQQYLRGVFKPAEAIQTNSNTTVC